MVGTTPTPERRWSAFHSDGAQCVQATTTHDCPHTHRYEHATHKDATEVTMSTPPQAGQAVRDPRGRIGITTDAPRAKSPRIGVMFIGANYSVLAQVDELTVIQIVEATS